MKVLITGKHSYIGNSFADYIAGHTADEIDITKISLRDEAWKQMDLSVYDVIIHVAGKAHADTGRVSEDEKKEYYTVNRDLTEDFAKKVRADRKNVGERALFIYLSSIIVYGQGENLREHRVITNDTKPAPSNFYGDSKLQAESRLQELADENLQIAVLRPPMIYGKGSRGNYPLLSKLARKLPIFPDIQNERSMLYIGNLCEFMIWLCKYQVENKDVYSIYYPQNSEYVSTSSMVQEISGVHGHSIHLTKALNPFLRVGSRLPFKPGRLINKAFGNLVYDKGISLYPELGEYQIYGIEESIRLTEN